MINPMKIAQIAINYIYSNHKPIMSGVEQLPF